MSLEQSPIIDKVFIKELGFDLKKFEELKKERYFEIKFSQLNTPLIRSTIVQNCPSSEYLKTFLKNDTTSLKNIVTKQIKRGKQPEYTEEGVRVIKTLNIQKGKINFEDVQFVSNEFLTKNEEKAGVHQYDLLLTSTGMGRGKFALYDDEEICFADSHISIIRFNHEMFLPYFLNYYCQSIFGTEQLKYIEMHIKGTPEIYESQLNEFRIPNIPLSKQQEIVNEIKAELDREEEIQQQIKDPRIIINDVFVRSFNLNVEKFNELKKIKNNQVELSDFSYNKDLRFSVKFHRIAGKFILQELKNITNKKIKDFIDEPIVLGVSVSPSDYDDDGDFYYISMANIKNWKFESEDSRLVSIEYSNKNRNKTVALNDIIIARSGEGTIGKVALIDSDELQGIFADFTMRIRLSSYNPLFAYYYFRTEYFQYLVEINKKGLGNNTNIFPSQIQEFPLIDISLTEQQKIVDEIKGELDKQDKIRQQINVERNKIRELIEKAIA